MKRLLQFWKDEIDRNNFVAAVLVVFCINAFFNGRMGWNTADDALDGLLYGGGFVAFAFIGAYAAAAQRWYKGGLRTILLGFVAIQLIIGQMAGWQAIGLILEAGASKTDAKVAVRSSIDKQFDRYVAERKTIGTLKPLNSLKAQAALECSERRGGVGPRCTEWRDKIGQAERAAFLDHEIKRLANAKLKGPQIRDAGTQYEVPTTLANFALANWYGEPVVDDKGKPAEWAVNEGDTRFALQMFLTFAFELVATFGFLVCGVGVTPPEPRKPGILRDERDVDLDVADNDDPEIIEPAYRQRQREFAGRRAGARASREAATGHASNSTPVTINFSTTGGGSVEGNGETLPPVYPRPAPAQSVESQQVSEAVVQEGPPSPVSDRPVNRDHARRHADQLRTFRAACLVDDAASVLSGDDLYERYRAWAEGRAMTRSAFFELLADCAGIDREIVGDAVQFRGVDLRETRANLRVVGGAA